MDDAHGGTDGFVLEEENYRHDRAQPISTYQANKSVTRMAWTSQSPGESPIENVWGLL